MTTYNKTTLKTFFEDGDVPGGADYANFIDSYVNLVETADQSMAGALITPSVTATLVSATNLNVGTFGISTLSVGSLNVSGNTIVSGNANFSGLVTVSSLLVLNNISAATLNLTGGITADRITASTAVFTGIVSAGGLAATNGVQLGNAIVSAAGTTQGAATKLTSIINRCQGVTDGSATGFLIQSNIANIPIYVINQTAASANLWPPTGGTINALGANAAFGLAANTMYTVIPITASAYYVK